VSPSSGCDGNLVQSTVTNLPLGMCVYLFADSCVRERFGMVKLASIRHVFIWRLYSVNYELKLSQWDRRDCSLSQVKWHNSKTLVWYYISNSRGKDSQQIYSHGNKSCDDRAPHWKCWRNVLLYCVCVCVCYSSPSTSGPLCVASNWWRRLQVQERSVQ
jgi:hypothetical protein